MSAGCLLGGWLVAGALTGAGPVAAARPKPAAFPTTAELRTIQLATFACSRENGAEACSRARSLADPLMDNPLLPSFCKDTVWSIVQQAEPAATNSFRRRDELDRAGELLLRRCQRPTAATTRKQETAPRRPPAAGGGAGSGGPAGAGGS
jgi:hypothetical protein